MNPRSAMIAGVLGLGVVNVAHTAPQLPPPPVAAISPLALSCTGCHQSKINSSEMPALNRLRPRVIAAALRRSRDAPAPGSIMARFTAKLSDEDIEALAHELGRATLGGATPRRATLGGATPRRATLGGPAHQ